MKEALALIAFAAAFFAIVAGWPLGGHAAEWLAPGVGGAIWLCAYPFLVIGYLQFAESRA